MKQVFVLGAGFTKAFLPNAPLIQDKFCVDEWQKSVESLPVAKKVLDFELDRLGNGAIDIEHLLTRLEALMPYDDAASAPELGVLRALVLKCLVKTISDAREEMQHSDTLKRFAGYCIQNTTTCITFNYDDLLDEALYLGQKPDFESWHPDGGYGFFCLPSEATISTYVGHMGFTPMLLLKLHGSLTWRIRKGYRQPYAIDSLVHHDLWSAAYKIGNEWDEKRREAIEFHLEESPFIVPPILMKGEFNSQPILRAVWSYAYQKLAEAEQVTFIGYSLPQTDIAAASLFGEALSHRPDIKIVGRVEGLDRLKETYTKVFPWIDMNSSFDGNGAVDFINEHIPS